MYMLFTNIIPRYRYAINKICKMDTHLIATGDDEGIVKVSNEESHLIFFFFYHPAHV